MATNAQLEAELADVRRQLEATGAMLDAAVLRLARPADGAPAASWCVRCSGEACVCPGLVPHPSGDGFRGFYTAPRVAITVDTYNANGDPIVVPGVRSFVRLGPADPRPVGEEWNGAEDQIMALGDALSRGGPAEDGDTTWPAAVLVGHRPPLWVAQATTVTDRWALVTEAQALTLDEAVATLQVHHASRCRDVSVGVLELELTLDRPEP